MIKEDYVSFETAKLLKKKGFDWECACISHPQCGMSLLGHMINNTGLQLTREADLCIDKENLLTIPTLQMTVKWFLKKYNIFICVLFLEESDGYGYTIENIVKKKYVVTSKNSSYKEPEEACEAAIRYCLENLI
jgi:hypothetical protein